MNVFSLIVLTVNSFVLNFSTVQINSEIHIEMVRCFVLIVGSSGALGFLVLLCLIYFFSCRLCEHRMQQSQAGYSTGFCNYQGLSLFSAISIKHCSNLYLALICYTFSVQRCFDGNSERYTLKFVIIWAEDMHCALQSAVTPWYMLANGYVFWYVLLCVENKNLHLRGEVTEVMREISCAVADQKSCVLGTHIISLAKVWGLSFISVLSPIWGSGCAQRCTNDLMASLRIVGHVK